MNDIIAPKSWLFPERLDKLLGSRLPEKSVLAPAMGILVLCGARNRPLEPTERAIVTGMGSNQSSRWSYDALTKAFDEMAAFSTRVFAKVGKRPHAHSEKVNWATFDCAECIEWQKRFDAAFKEELDKLNNRPPSD